MFTFDEIYNAYETANSFRSEAEGAAYVNVADEKIIVLLPEDFYKDDEQREADEEALETGTWIELPERMLMGLGNKYVSHFAAKHLSDEDFDYVREMFTHSGAFAQWRAFLRGKGLINEWHKYEYEEEVRQLKAWLNIKGIPFSDDDRRG